MGVNDAKGKGAERKTVELRPSFKLLKEMRTFNKRIFTFFDKI